MREVFPGRLWIGNALDVADMRLVLAAGIEAIAAKFAGAGKKSIGLPQAMENVAHQPNAAFLKAAR